jgi:AcrR family transcriptional regulator
MGRTREAALDGAVRAVAKYGSRKATMADIAMLAGVAKATLYNHFRTRDDVYRAVVAAQVKAIAAAGAARLPEGIEIALLEVASRIAQHPAVRKIAADEPAVLAELVRIGDGGSWAAVRTHVATLLQAGELDHSDAAVDLVARFLASQLTSPSSESQRRAGVRLLVRALTAEVDLRDRAEVATT